MDNQSKKICYFLISDVILCIGTLILFLFSGLSVKEALRSPIMIFEYIYITVTWIIYFFTKQKK